MKNTFAEQSISRASISLIVEADEKKAKELGIALATTIIDESDVPKAFFCMMARR